MQMKTGSEVVNKALEGAGGLVSGQLSGVVVNPIPAFNGPQTTEGRLMKLGCKLSPVSNIERGMGILAMGTDAVTGRSVVFAKKSIGIPVIGGELTTDIFVVHDAAGKPESGLFFVTRTLAECHFVNITGKATEQDIETGGRTLRELADYLTR